MANAIDVAKYLIHLRDIDEYKGQYCSLSNLKLQKLLYYCQGGHYMWDGKPLITDKLFEAWPYGPVIDEVYHFFKEFGQNDLQADGSYDDLTKDEKETIEAIWEQLKNKHAFDLVDSTHQEAPWKNANDKKEIFISNDAIKDYFINKEETS